VVEDYVFQRYTVASLANWFKVFVKEHSYFLLKAVEFQEKC